MRRALRFRASGVAGALVTHAHGDHARGVRDALGASIDCYMSAGAARDAGVAGHHRLTLLTAHEAVMVGPFLVYPFEAIHDAAEPLNFVVRGPSCTKLLYVSDSSYCPYRFDGLGIVAIEANYSTRILRENVESGSIPRVHMHRVLASHMSIERAVELLKANDLSRVEEIHLLHLSDGNSHADEFQQLVARASGKPTYIADRKETAA